MSDVFRVLLLIGAVFTLIFFFRQIASSRMQIASAVSWSIFSFMLVLLAVFPQIMIDGAVLLEVESPANLLFLVILCVLIFQLFLSTVKVSKLEQKIDLLTQYIAIEKWKEERKENK